MPLFCHFDKVRDVATAYEQNLSAATALGQTASIDKKGKWLAERKKEEEEAGSSAETRAPGLVPVYCLPSVSLTLPTVMGPVCFQPAFLSRDQLSATWVSKPPMPRCSAACSALYLGLSRIFWSLLP
jgi:hypothetical protein